MSRADEVFALFVDANPVADVTTAVRDRPRVQSILPRLEGSVDMQTQDRSTQLEPPPKPPRRTGPLIPALAGAAAMIVAIVVAVAVFGGPSGGSDTATPVAGAEEVAVVVSAYETLNAGDIDAWVGHFTDDAVIFGESSSVARSLYGVQAAANYRAELVEACRGIAPGQVECTITESDDFHSAGGITLTRSEVFVINEDGQISEATAQVISFTQPGYFVFNQAFFDWLRTAHPEIHAEIGPDLTTHLPATPEHMRTALDYLDEFLAQSDTYPLGG
jgi:ketosteroid isomerase-like protein